MGICFLLITGFYLRSFGFDSVLVFILSEGRVLVVFGFLGYGYCNIFNKILGVFLLLDGKLGVKD